MLSRSLVAPGSAAVPASALPLGARHARLRGTSNGELASRPVTFSSTAATAVPSSPEKPEHHQHHQHSTAESGVANMRRHRRRARSRADVRLPLQRVLSVTAPKIEVNAIVEATAPGEPGGLPQSSGEFVRGVGLEVEIEGEPERVHGVTRRSGRVRGSALRAAPLRPRPAPLVLIPERALLVEIAACAAHRDHDADTRQRADEGLSERTHSRVEVAQRSTHTPGTSSHTVFTTRS